MRESRKSTTIALSAMFLILTPWLAFAYIDPGTGSYVIQVVLAAVFGGLVVLKVFWGKIKSFFTPRRVRDAEAEQKPGN
jgi:hypothetical protein